MHSISRRPHRPLRSPRARTTQRGIVLLEALVALLIFAVGVLGLIGLQVTSVKQAAAAEYRSTAVLQANDLISRMWTADRFATDWNNQFDSATSGAAYTAWKAAWASALPGAGISGNEPEVSFKKVDGGIAGTRGTILATIVIKWKAPSDDEKRNYTVVAQLDQPQK